MSPSESQLRAALREGAGKGVDAGLIIANAERYRRARRQRITYAAAAVVVAAFVGVGGTLLADSGTGGGNAGGSAESRAAGGGVAPYARASTQAAPSAPRGRFGAVPNAAACPAAPTRVVVPVGTGPAAGQLLPADVSRITACGYPTGAQAARSVVLTGARARDLAATLNRGTVRPIAADRTCSAPDDRAGRIALLPADANGRSVKTVLVTVRCSRAVATNGMAARYLATVPPELNRLVR